MGVLCLSPLTIQRRVMLLPAEAKMEGLPSMDNEGTKIAFFKAIRFNFPLTCNCESEQPAEFLRGAHLALVLPGIAQIRSPETRELQI